jgi:outer membrane protein OmpA-like peptidoglycan-associated protein
MRIFLVCLFLLCIFSVYPHSISGKSNYANLEADSPEVQLASEEALKLLDANRGAIALENNIVDIIGIPKGLDDTGLSITGRVEQVEKALQDLEADVTEREIRMILPSDILFDFDKYNIRADAKEALANVAVVIKAYPEQVPLIEGHTDSMGSDEYNLVLSEKRAESVKYWLQQKEQLNDRTFQTKGWGERKPKATNETKEGRQENRRVEITIMK